jgi:hypothetical protein
MLGRVRIGYDAMTGGDADQHHNPIEQQRPDRDSWYYDNGRIDAEKPAEEKCCPEDPNDVRGFSLHELLHYPEDATN